MSIFGFFRRKGVSYPLAYADVTYRLGDSIKLLASRRVRNGSFIGLTPLEGTFLEDEPERIFATLEIGERLSVTRDESTKNQANPVLSVNRADGTAIGTLPFTHSILPNALIDRGKTIFCLAEAKQLEGGLVSVAVSIYSEK